MTYKIVIPGRLPGLNEYTAACRSHAQRGGQMKREAEEMVLLAIAAQRSRDRFPAKFREPVRLHYKFYEPNRRRDQDNVSAFARKVIQDALVMLAVIKNDGWGSVAGSDEVFGVDKASPRIEVEIEEAE